jgi:nucleoside-diphosphate-sugar epimerase
LKKILITGGGGYVGSMLIPKLISAGYEIKCLDRFFFGDEFLKKNQLKGKLELIRDDIRWFNPKILENIDVVMDLAALSNDPVGELNPEKTFEINHLGRVRVAKLSRDAGVPQYILASSASIYGQQENIANETSPVSPLTVYSKANHKAEMDVLKLKNSDFAVTVLRFSSIYGKSERMRFDISVNSMVLDLFKTGKIVVRGKKNTRPFIHIKDAVKAYEMVLLSDLDKISGEILNVGSNNQNYSMEELSKQIGKSIESQFELELGNNVDHRSYSLNFDKIKKLIGFSTDYTLSDGVKEIFESLKNGTLIPTTQTITLDWYKKILNDKELFEKFQINGKIL